QPEGPAALQPRRLVLGDEAGADQQADEVLAVGTAPQLGPRRLRQCLPVLIQDDAGLQQGVEEGRQVGNQRLGGPTRGGRDADGGAGGHNWFRNSLGGRKACTCDLAGEAGRRLRRRTTPVCHTSVPSDSLPVGPTREFVPRAAWRSPGASAG